MHETSIEEAKNYIGHINLSLPYGIDPTREINTFLANPNEYIRQIYLKDYLIINLLSRCKELEKSQIKCPTCATAPPPVPPLASAPVPTPVPVLTKTCTINKDRLKPLLKNVKEMQEQINNLEKEVTKYKVQLNIDVEEVNRQIVDLCNS